jgi:hypothetical protein
MEEMLCVTCTHSRVCKVIVQFSSLKIAINQIEKEPIHSAVLHCAEYRKDTGTLRGEIDE